MVNARLARWSVCYETIDIWRPYPRMQVWKIPEKPTLGRAGLASRRVTFTPGLLLAFYLGRPKMR